MCTWHWYYGGNRIFRFEILAYGAMKNAAWMERKNRVVHYPFRWDNSPYSVDMASNSNANQHTQHGQVVSVLLLLLLSSNFSYHFSIFLPLPHPVFPTTELFVTSLAMHPFNGWLAVHMLSQVNRKLAHDPIDVDEFRKAADSLLTHAITES